MLNHYREDFSSRLTNNVVENYFGFLKHNLLKRKKMFPSELTAILSKNLIATYIEDYNQNDESCSISVNLNKIKKKSNEPCERWGDGKHDKNSNKGSYYQRRDIFDQRSYLFDEINQDFNEFFP